MSANEDRIQFDLSRSEALVLFELLADFGEQPAVPVPSSAERLALLRLHAALERTLVEPFCSDFAEKLTEARDHLRAQYGSDK